MPGSIRSLKINIEKNNWCGFPSEELLYIWWINSSFEFCLFIVNNYLSLMRRNSVLWLGTCKYDQLMTTLGSWVVSASLYLIFIYLLNKKIFSFWKMLLQYVLEIETTLRSSLIYLLMKLRSSLYCLLNFVHKSKARNGKKVFLVINYTVQQCTQHLDLHRKYLGGAHYLISVIESVGTVQFALIALSHYLFKTTPPCMHTNTCLSTKYTCIIYNLNNSTITVNPIF